MEGETTESRPSPPEGGAGNVTRLEHDGREIFVVGAAHVSKKSVEEVRRVIDELRPDTVCVELDPARYETLRDETRWERLDVREIVRSGRTGLFFSSLLFSGFQKRLGDRLGVRPGTEMLAAADAAQQIGAAVVLADRDIQATLMRCYRSLGPLDRAKVFLVLGMLPFAASDIDEAQVEQLKDRKTMVDVMATFAREMPALETPLITERDRYLMASVAEAPGRRIVAVVGAAHVPGMIRHLGKPVDRAALCIIPPRTTLSRALGWLSPLIVAALVALSLVRGLHGAHLFSTLAPSALPAVFGALCFSLLVGADFPTALLAGVLAPITLILPLVDLGRVTALAQASRHPPSPEDGARLRADVLAPKSARKNAFLRVLLVAIASSFGRSLGAAVGFVWALTRIFF